MRGKIKVAEYIVSFLESKGIKNIFMLSGGFCLPMVDAVANSDIKYTCNLHEQAAAIAAEAYAQYTGDPGVCMVTAGPGGTNAITGVASAWLDSIPMIILSGQVQSKDLKGSRKVRQIGFQEIDIVKIVDSITKYSVTVQDPKDIKCVMECAWHQATTGRQGPVWIDIPLDIQSAQINEHQLRGFSAEQFLPSSGTNKQKTLTNKVSKFYDLIKESKRPVILAGNGIRSSGAKDKFLSLAEKLGIPVLTTWKSVDFMSENHPLFVGRPGLIAQRGANFSQQNSDLFISIGSRLDLGQTAFNHDNFARKAKKIIVDVDQAEIDKMQFDVDCEINFDASDFIDEALKQLDSLENNFSDWLSICKNWQEKYPVILEEYWQQEQCVNNYVLIDVLSKLAKPGNLIVPGSSGACSEVTMQAFKVKDGIRVFNSEGLGSMGFGIPASIGGCIASNRAETICIDGDGGFVMNIQELETVKRLNLPIKYFVLNNGGYVSIRNSQDKHFDKQIASGEDSGVTLPDIEKVCRSYGIKYRKLENHDNITENTQEILSEEGPVICEVIMLHTHESMPRNSTHKDENGVFVSLPMEDLLPLLPRDEFARNMSVGDD
jgi:acetolactate synthase-1/2/3 large subunit